MVSLGKFLEYELDGDKVRVVGKPGSLKQLLDVADKMQGELETAFDAVLLGSLLVGTGSVLAQQHLKGNAGTMLKLVSEMGANLGKDMLIEDAAKPQGDA